MIAQEKRKIFFSNIFGMDFALALLGKLLSVDTNKGVYLCLCRHLF